MKVLQILPELNSGGVERGTLEVASYLIRQGHEAVVVSNGGRLVPELEANGARHIALPVHRKSLSSLLQVRKLRALFEREKLDIIHIRSRVPGWLAWLAWKTMDPLSRPRLVSTVHGFYSVNAYSAIMTKGERVIAVSESIKDYILTNYPKTPAGKIRRIYRGIEPSRYPSGYQPANEWLSKWREEHPECLGKEVLLLPGRITRLKGHEDFFQLIASLKKEGRQVHGLVAGGVHPKKETYRHELQLKVEEMEIGENVSFLGHRADLKEVMAVSDVVCALSQQPESFGRTVLEALAIGKPVVGYDCGGVGELLDSLFPEGEVPLGDTEKLHMTTSRVLKEQLLPRAPEGCFTLEVMCRATLDVYEELHAEQSRCAF